VCRGLRQSHSDRRGGLHALAMLQSAGLILGDDVEELLSRSLEMQDIFSVEVFGLVFLAGLHREIEGEAREVTDFGAEHLSGVDLRRDAFRASERVERKLPAAPAADIAIMRDDRRM